MVARCSFAGWLLHSIRLAAALGLALVAMQAPAVTREYQAALLQLVRSSDEEIAQRKASAERFYGIAPGEDEDAFSPSCAPWNRRMQKPSPQRSAARVACGHRITGSTQPRLLGPVVATKDVAEDKEAVVVR